MPTRCPASSRSAGAGEARRSAGADLGLLAQGKCKSTIRNSYQILSRGTPNLENQLWNVSAQVMNGTMTPEAAGKQLQNGLDNGISRPSDGAAEPFSRQAGEGALAQRRAGGGRARPTSPARG